MESREYDAKANVVFSIAIIAQNIAGLGPYSRLVIYFIKGRLHEFQ